MYHRVSHSIAFIVASSGKGSFPLEKLDSIERQTISDASLNQCLSSVSSGTGKQRPPARMDDWSPVIFYSTCNQAVAATVKNNPAIDTITSTVTTTWQSIYSPRSCPSTLRPTSPRRTKCVQFGDISNVLHVTASFISVHQNSVGAAGMSDKCGQHSWARYHVCCEYFPLIFLTRHGFYSPFLTLRTAHRLISF